jgi:hypothetical protein
MHISAWLPQIAHFNIFVFADKNANEPAGVLPQWQNSGSSCLKCYGRCNTALSGAVKIWILWHYDFRCQLKEFTWRV